MVVVVVGIVGVHVRRHMSFVEFVEYTERVFTQGEVSKPSTNNSTTLSSSHDRRMAGWLAGWVGFCMRQTHNPLHSTPAPQWWIKSSPNPASFWTRRTQQQQELMPTLAIALWPHRFSLTMFNYWPVYFTHRTLIFKEESVGWLIGLVAACTKGLLLVTSTTKES